MTFLASDHADQYEPIQVNLLPQLHLISQKGLQVCFPFKQVSQGLSAICWSFFCSLAKFSRILCSSDLISYATDLQLAVMWLLRPRFEGRLAPGFWSFLCVGRRNFLFETKANSSRSETCFITSWNNFALTKSDVFLAPEFSSAMGPYSSGSPFRRSVLRNSSSNPAIIP